ncbi:MAG: helix-turn-helix transcriptional regulator [Clostridia bacterium]|nr:helix-turn-helix transcriptional regulator [Clostridia bacterium]
MKKIVFENNKNIIGDGLRAQRLLCRLSQDNLAAKMQTLGVNMDQQMISKIERNARIVTDYELACFCRILKVSAEELWQGKFKAE